MFLDGTHFLLTAFVLLQIALVSWHYPASAEEITFERNERSLRGPLVEIVLDDDIVDADLFARNNGYRAFIGNRERNARKRDIGDKIGDIKDDVVEAVHDAKEAVKEKWNEVKQDVKDAIMDMVLKEALNQD